MMNKEGNRIEAVKMMGYKSKEMETKEGQVCEDAATGTSLAEVDFKKVLSEILHFSDHERVPPRPRFGLDPHWMGHQ